MTRKRRKFSTEFKAEAVRLVQESSKSLAELFPVPVAKTQLKVPSRRLAVSGNAVH